MRRFIAPMVLFGILLVPTSAHAEGLRILEPREGTRVRVGQVVTMRGVGCPPGGEVWFEDGTAMRAERDGSFTTAFEIPPGATPYVLLDAKCGGVTKEVRLIRSSG